MKRAAWWLLALLVAAVQIGCGGGGSSGTTPPTPVVGITISPTTATVASGGTQQFSATVTGSSNTAVTWTASAGTINSSGLFTAPAVTTQTTVTVTATASADTSKSATATVTVNAPPPPVSITISPTTATVSSGGTQQFTATVTGSSNTAVTWTASSGTINSSGLFTAPAVTAQTTVTVTATSAADTSKSASATVMVTTPPPPAITITGIVPSPLYLDSEAIVGNIQINGSGFAAGDVLHIGPPFSDLTLAQGTASNQILVNLGFDTSHYMPGWITFSVSDGNGNTSNTANLAFLGNQNTLAMSATQAFNSEGLGSPVARFALPSGSLVGTYSGDGPGIAVDNLTGYVVVGEGSTGRVFWHDPSTGATKGQVYATSATMAVAAKNGVGCTTQPSAGLLSCFDLGQASPPMISAAAGQQPWSLAMGDLGSGATAETDAVVYSRADTTLWRFTITDTSGTVGVTAQNALTLTGITPASGLGVGQGGWQVVLFSSGPMAGKGAFLSDADKVLVWFDTQTMTMIGAPVTLTGNPFRLAADETHGKAIVAFADPDAGLTRFAAVGSDGSVTTLTTTTQLLAAGLQVSPDGASIYAAMRDQFAVLPNQ